MIQDCSSQHFLKIINLFLRWQKNTGIFILTGNGSYFRLDIHSIGTFHLYIYSRKKRSNNRYPAVLYQRISCFLYKLFTDSKKIRPKTLENLLGNSIIHRNIRSFYRSDILSTRYSSFSQSCIKNFPEIPLTNVFERAIIITQFI